MDKIKFPGTTNFELSKEQKEKHDRMRKMINDTHPCRDKFRDMLQERIDEVRNK